MSKPIGDDGVSAKHANHKSVLQTHWHELRDCGQKLISHKMDGMIAILFVGTMWVP